MSSPAKTAHIASPDYVEGDVMQFQASNSFVGAFDTDVHSGALSSANEPRADMHPVTLDFRDGKLEHDYLQAMRRQTAAVVRFGVMLALGVFLLFGMLDLWMSSSHAGLSWTLRAAVFVATVMLFCVSFTPLFEQYREAFMLPFSVLLGLGMTVLLATVPAGEIDRYFAGYMLIIVAAYTVFGLRFFNATLVSLLLLGMYVAVEFVVHAHEGPVPLSNFAFVFSTFIITAVGGYIYERQRRLAHYRLRLIAHERARSEHIALHDALTGLPNRRLLMERLQHALARDKRFHTYAAVLFIDLDNFKPVNDSHGHEFGDRLLRDVAKRLKDVVRDTDTVARVGGDEFVVLLEDLEAPQCAHLMKERLLAAFDAPLFIDDEALKVQLSVGCALDPLDARTPRDLLQSADRAMYQMKQRRGRR